METDIIVIGRFYNQVKSQNESSRGSERPNSRLSMNGIFISSLLAFFVYNFEFSLFQSNKWAQKWSK